MRKAADNERSGNEGPARRSVKTKTRLLFQPAISVYGSHAQPVYGFLSSENKKWNNPSVPRYSYDPEKARALLAEIGLANRGGDGTLQDASGNPVGFNLISSFENPIRGKIAMLIQDDLNALGIRLDYKAIDFKTLLKRINVSQD